MIESSSRLVSDWWIFARLVRIWNIDTRAPRIIEISTGQRSITVSKLWFTRVTSNKSYSNDRSNIRNRGTIAHDSSFWRTTPLILLEISISITAGIVLDRREATKNNYFSRRNYDRRTVPFFQRYREHVSRSQLPGLFTSPWTRTLTEKKKYIYIFGCSTNLLVPCQSCLQLSIHRSETEGRLAFTRDIRAAIINISTWHRGVEEWGESWLFAGEILYAGGLVLLFFGSGTVCLRMDGADAPGCKSWINLANPHLIEEAVG